MNKAKKAIVILFILRNNCKFKKTCNRTRLSDIDDERSVVITNGNWLVLPFPDKGVDATFVVVHTQSPTRDAAHCTRRINDNTYLVNITIVVGQTVYLAIGMEYAECIRKEQVVGKNHQRIVIVGHLKVEIKLLPPPEHIRRFHVLIQQLQLHAEALLVRMLIR